MVFIGYLLYIKASLFNTNTSSTAAIDLFWEGERVEERPRRVQNEVVTGFLKVLLVWCSSRVTVSVTEELLELVAKRKFICKYLTEKNVISDQSLKD